MTLTHLLRARTRALTAIAVLSAATLCVAGCTGPSVTSAAGGSQTKAAGPADAAGSTGTPASPAAAGTAAQNSGTVGSGSNSSATGTQVCGNGALKLTISAVSAAMEHDDLVLVFTNTGGHPCTVKGYPGAAVMNGSTVVLNARRTLNGYIGDQQHLRAAPLVTLAPGAAASAVLEWVQNAGEACYPAGSGSLEVTAPNTTDTVSVPYRSPYTVGSDGMICAGFEIHPVVATTFN